MKKYKQRVLSVALSVLLLIGSMPALCASAAAPDVVDLIKAIPLVIYLEKNPLCQTQHDVGVMPQVISKAVYLDENGRLCTQYNTINHPLDPCHTQDWYADFPADNGSMNPPMNPSGLETGLYLKPGTCKMITWHNGLNSFASPFGIGETAALYAYSVVVAPDAQGNDVAPILNTSSQAYCQLQQAVDAYLLALQTWARFWADFDTAFGGQSLSEVQLAMMNAGIDTWGFGRDVRLTLDAIQTEIRTAAWGMSDAANTTVPMSGQMSNSLMLSANNLTVGTEVLQYWQAVYNGNTPSAQRDYRFVAAYPTVPQSIWGAQMMEQLPSAVWDWCVFNLMCPIDDHTPLRYVYACPSNAAIQVTLPEAISEGYTVFNWNQTTPQPTAGYQMNIGNNTTYDAQGNPYTEFTLNLSSQPSQSLPGVSQQALFDDLDAQIWPALTEKICSVVLDPQGGTWADDNSTQSKTRIGNYWDTFNLPLSLAVSKPGYIMAGWEADIIHPWDPTTPNNNSPWAIDTFPAACGDMEYFGAAAEYRAIWEDASRWSYTTANGEVTITGFSDPNEDTVNVPDNIGGLPVTAISGTALFQGTNKTIFIPSTIRSISADAFLAGNVTYYYAGTGGYFSAADGVLYSGDSKTLLRYPDASPQTSYSVPASCGVTAIGESAFAGCQNLQSVTLPDSLLSVGSAAFASCTALQNITIPASVTAIGQGAFSGCTALAFATLPDGLLTISDTAFSGCTSLTSIHIPSSVTSIGADAFDGCTSLEYICSDTDNGAAKAYAAANGIEFRNCSAAADPHDRISVTLDDSIGVNLLLDLDARSAQSVTVQYKDLNGNPQTDTLTDFSALPQVDGGLYKLQVRIAPAQIADGITVTIDGSALTANVRDYCDTLLEGDFSSEVKALAQALLDYGQTASSFFSYPGAQMSTLTNLSADAAEAWTLQLNDTTGKLQNASFMALTQPEFRLYMRDITEQQAAQYNHSGAVTVGYTNPNISDTLQARFVQNNNGILLEVTGVAAERMDETIEVTISGLGTITFAGNDFAKLMLGNAATRPLGAALYTYGAAAKACAAP